MMAMADCFVEQGKAKVVRTLDDFGEGPTTFDFPRNLFEVAHKGGSVSLAYEGEHAKQVVRTESHRHLEV